LKLSVGRYILSKAFSNICYIYFWEFSQNQVCFDAWIKTLKLLVIGCNYWTNNWDPFTNLDSRLWNHIWKTSRKVQLFADIHWSMWFHDICEFDCCLRFYRSDFFEHNVWLAFNWNNNNQV